MNLRTAANLLFVFALVCLGIGSPAASAAECQNIAVPAYFYPSQPTSQ
jgi:hypothetical protein